MLFCSQLASLDDVLNASAVFLPPSSVPLPPHPGSSCQGKFKNCDQVALVGSADPFPSLSTCDRDRPPQEKDGMQVAPQ